MSAAILTLEIAEQVQAGLVSAVDNADISVVAHGVSDFNQSGGDRAILPCVMVTLAEFNPMQYTSRQLMFPMTITAATFINDDPDQIQIYTIAHAISLWLVQPTISLTLGTFDSITIESSPNPDQIIDERQKQQWSCVVHVLRNAS